ncbi:hypothetical protein [Mycolicibacterium elephantis]
MQSPENQKRRCTGHKKTGERCGNYAIRGGYVCNYHGGKAKQVRAKARQRLENAADRLAKELLRMALDADVENKVKLAAIRDALDRGGLKVGEQVEISLKPWEQIGESIQLVTSTRADYMRSIGQTPEPDDSRIAPGYDDPPALASDPNAPIDAEVVDPHEEFAHRMTGAPSCDADQAETYEADDRERAARLAGVTTPLRPSNLPMPLDQARELEAALARRRTPTPIWARRPDSTAVGDTGGDGPVPAQIHRPGRRG